MKGCTARLVAALEQLAVSAGRDEVLVKARAAVAPFTLDREDCMLLSAAQREITKSSSALLTFKAVADGKASIDLDETNRRVVIVRAHGADDYPPWEQLLKGVRPETPTPPEYIFNPRYLAAIQQVIEADGDNMRGVAVKAWTGIEPGGYCGPMLFESGSGIRFLIMAMRAA